MKSSFSFTSATRKALITAVALAFAGTFAAASAGEYDQGSKPAGSMEAKPGAATAADPGGVGLNAQLLGAKGEVLSVASGGTYTADNPTVRVEVKGVAMVDPATTGGVKKTGQGHLHYRVDRQPIIATTATELTFRNLGPGPHTIEVMLAANDHTPLGPQQVIRVNGSETASPRTETMESTTLSKVPEEMRSAQLKAQLVSKDEKAKKGEATVQADLAGVPGSTSSGPVIIYRMDDGPSVATRERKLSFHGIEPGAHTITVALATPEYVPFGTVTKLDLKVPESGAAASY
jgi:hypothetical protein